MVLADAIDTGHDSAVFLEGGSFDIGIKIVDEAGASLPGTINMCDNTPKVLKAQVAAIPGMTFQWYKDGVLIPGATNATYTAAALGSVYGKGNDTREQLPGEASITIVGGTSPTVHDAVLKLCSTPALTTFNLEDAKPLSVPLPERYLSSMPPRQMHKLKITIISPTSPIIAEPTGKYYTYLFPTVLFVVK